MHLKQGHIQPHIFPLIFLFRDRTMPESVCRAFLRRVGEGSLGLRTVTFPRRTATGSSPPGLQEGRAAGKGAGKWDVQLVRWDFGRGDRSWASTACGNQESRPELHHPPSLALQGTRPPKHGEISFLPTMSVGLPHSLGTC